MKQKTKVQVWIYTKDGRDTLLLKTTPQRGSLWQPVTGGVNRGENLLAASLREVYEETGRTFHTSPRPVGYEFGYEKKGTQFREICFSLESESQFNVKIDPKEHADAKWVALEEALQDLHYESNREALKKLIQILK